MFAPTAWARPVSVTRPLARTVTVLAALAALAVGLVPPLTYVFAFQSRQAGMLESRALLYAAEVADSAQQDPTLWNSLVDQTTRRPSENSPPTSDDADPSSDERRAIYDRAGLLVRQSMSSRSLPWPTLSVRAPIMDGRNEIGKVEISRSLRSGLMMTSAVAAGSVLFGLLIFLALRLLPLRLLDEAIELNTYLSAHDVLTGLPNRALFTDRLEQMLASTRREGGDVAVLCLDLDKFKEINDTLGHPAGDLLLRIVAARLRSCLRETELAARLGGDEFAVIQSHVKQPQGARLLAQRLIEAIAPPFDLDGCQASVGVSVGIAVSADHAHSDSARMMQEADVALYHAKKANLERFCFFNQDMGLRLQERRAMELDLRAAVSDDALFLHYQPQVDLRTRQIIGAEALLRWDRPGHGLISPASFIPVAEEMGLIGAIGGRLLRQACFEATGWPEHMVVAVNVSPIQLRRPDFSDRVMAALADSGLDPSRLELEVTEGVLMQATEDTLATLARLRQAGIHLAMDDFGTGYSSLGYLQRFRFDKIKIDRSFVARMTTDAETVAIVRTIVELGEAFSTGVIAEGVETEAEARLLQAEHCRQAQGYLFGKPMSPEQFRTLLSTQSHETDFHSLKPGPAPSLAPDITGSESDHSIDERYKIA
jgi:diguanylate cyclase (GGDEF)-like protein